MYFFTSAAMSSNPVSSLYNKALRAIRELLMLVYAVATALFLVNSSACFAVRVATLSSFSFGA